MRVLVTLTAEVELPDGIDLSKVYVLSAIALRRVHDRGEAEIVAVEHDAAKIELLPDDWSASPLAAPPAPTGDLRRTPDYVD